VQDVAARADTVLLSLPDGDATLAVVDAVLAAPTRRLTTVVDLSTVGPVAATTAAAALERIGVTYVDGPVSGGAAGARAGTISLMFAGPDAVLDAHRPIFAAIAGNIFPVGGSPGQGQAMKLLNNFLSATAHGGDVGGAHVRAGPRPGAADDGRRPERVERPQLGDRRQVPSARDHWYPTTPGSGRR